MKINPADQAFSRCVRESQDEGVNNSLMRYTT